MFKEDICCKSYASDEGFRSVFNNLLKVFSTARNLYFVFGADRIGFICISFFWRSGELNWTSKLQVLSWIFWRIKKPAALFYSAQMIFLHIFFQVKKKALFSKALGP
jgi:hypothetical protein